MNINISNSSGEPIYIQIADQIKTMILEGKLKEGEMLPSMRILATELRISFMTTKRAYEELERNGFIESNSVLFAYRLTWFCIRAWHHTRLWGMKTSWSVRHILYFRRNITRLSILWRLWNNIG